MKSLLLFLLFAFANVTVAQTGTAGGLELSGLDMARYQEHIERKDKLVMVYFKADWCVVCKKQQLILKQLKERFGDTLQLLEIDMEKNPVIAEKFEVDALPVLLIYREGYEVWNRVGLRQKDELESLLLLHRGRKKRQ